MDVGDYWDVDQKELRVLDDEFYAAPPAQVGQSVSRLDIRSISQSVRQYVHTYIGQSDQ